MTFSAEFMKQLIGGPSDFGLGWILLLFASIITIVAFAVSFSRWIIERIQKKKKLLRAISSLDVGANISYFENLLGTPVHNNKYGNFQEYIFVNYYFYIQTLTDEHSNVRLFSVTTRRENFHPALKSWDTKPLVKLGETTFSHFSNPKETITDGHHGGIDFYSESYYFGYDGITYRMYSFSFNSNGYGKFGSLPMSFYRNDTPQDFTATKKFREETVINTYTVSNFSGPDGYKALGERVYFGPRDYQVGIFRQNDQ